jgi:hypothetical protein
MRNTGLVKLFTEVLEVASTERVLASDKIAGTKLVEEHGQHYMYFPDLNRGVEMKLHVDKKNKWELNKSVVVIPGKIVAEKKLPSGNFYPVDYNVVVTITFHENPGGMHMQIDFI